MKNNTGYFFLLMAAVLMYCTPKIAPAPAASAISDADVQRGKIFWSDCTLEKLNAAHTLYTNKCGTCHALKDPFSEDEAGWRKIVPPMAKKAKLTDEEQALILNYVLTMREAGK